MVKESVLFLNTKVTIDGGCLVIDLYAKNTDTHQYLHCDCCHPYHCKKSILFSLALRLQRICSKSSDYLRHDEELKGYLVKMRI